MNGTVKFFNKEKGFGFIETEEGDIFVGSRGLETDLKDGDKVEFEVEETPRGKAAKDVKVVSE